MDVSLSMSLERSGTCFHNFTTRPEALSIFRLQSEVLSALNSFFSGVNESLSALNPFGTDSSTCIRFLIRCTRS
jgi:hypothetical protein